MGITVVGYFKAESRKIIIEVCADQSTGQSVYNELKMAHKAIEHCDKKHHNNGALVRVYNTIKNQLGCK